MQHIAGEYVQATMQDTISQCTPPLPQVPGIVAPLFQIIFIPPCVTRHNNAKHIGGGGPDHANVAMLMQWLPVEVLGQNTRKRNYFGPCV